MAHKHDGSLWIKDYSPVVFFGLSIEHNIQIGSFRSFNVLETLVWNACESIAWISLSKGCTIPEINNVITFDYFCHNSMVSVTGSGFQCRLIGS